MLPFNYHHLYYFYTIARLGSVSKACIELRLSQPTLSAQLRQFEKFLNLILFEREKRKMILTADGKRIFDYAAEIFNIGSEMMDNISDISHKGRIKIQIGISNHVSRVVVEDLFRFLQKLVPDVYISIIEDRIEELNQGIDNHELDMALSDSIPDMLPKDKIEYRLLAHIPVFFCAHESIASKIKNFPEDLNDAPFILPTRHSPMYQAIHEYFIMNKIKPKIVGEIQEHELINRLFLSGSGIALINKLTLIKCRENSSLKTISKKKHSRNL